MFIAIDIGGTNIRIAFSDRIDISNFFTVEKFPLSHLLDDDLKNIFEIIDKNSQEKVVKAITVGIAGTLSDDKRELVKSHHLPEWVNIEFPKILIERYNCPVFMDNDIVVASFSELYNDLEDGEYIYLAWGTGIGGAKFQKEKDSFVVDKLNHTEHLGEFEQQCGGNDIKKRLGKQISELNEEEWDEVVINFEQNIDKLSEMFNVKNFFLTGGVAYRQKDKLRSMIDNLKEKSINLAISKFGDDAGVYGGLALIKYNIK